MAETVGSHGVAAFTNPSNGDALDATIVKGNDNTLRAAYVNHDSDGGVHVQSSSLASRPSAGTVGRKWITNDSGSVRLWYDNGASWEEVAYVPSTGTATVDDLVVTDSLTVDGDTLVVDEVNDRVGVNTAVPTVALDVTGVVKASGGVVASGGGATITGNSTITGTATVSGLVTAQGGVTVTGTVTATTFSGSGASLTSIPAANLTGTLPAISGVNLTNLNASNVTTGSLVSGRLPSTITGRDTVQAGVFSGTSGTTTSVALDGSASAIFTVPTSGVSYRVTNNGSPNNYARTGPAGLSGYDGGQSDLFLVVESGGTNYYIRLERWTT